MFDSLKKKVIVFVVGLALTVLSGVVGFNLKGEVCGPSTQVEMTP